MDKRRTIIICITVIIISVIVYFLTQNKSIILPLQDPHEHVISDYALPNIPIQPSGVAYGGYASITSSLPLHATQSSTPYSCTPFKTLTAQSAQIQIDGRAYCVSTTSDGYAHNGKTYVTYTYSSPLNNEMGTENVTFNTEYDGCTCGVGGNGCDVCSELHQGFEDSLNVTVAKLFGN